MKHFGGTKSLAKTSYFWGVLKHLAPKSKKSCPLKFNFMFYIFQLQVKSQLLLVAALLVIGGCAQKQGVYGRRLSSRDSQSHWRSGKSLASTFPFNHRNAQPQHGHHGQDHHHAAHHDHGHQVSHNSKKFPNLNFPLF